MQVFSPALYIGVTLATFQSNGNSQLRIDWLKIKVSDGAILSATIFKT